MYEELTTSMNSERAGEKLSLVCEKIRNCMFPLLYPIIYSRQNEYKIIKAVAGFLYGNLLGIALYELILIDIQFTTQTCFYVGGTICLVLGLGNAISTQVRCISLLTLPAFCGRVGRGVLKAIVIAYILAGPIQSIGTNGQEVVRTFACSTTLTYNLTKARFDLIFRPFAEAVLNMKADTDEVKNSVHSIKNIVLPLAEEIEGEEEMRKIREENEYVDQIQGDSSREKEIKEKYKEGEREPEEIRYEKMYKRKMESKCADIISRGTENCRRMFGEAYDRCYKKVSWVAAWLLCWPMKLTFVCNIVEAMGGSKPCDASRILEPGFGEGYAYLKRSSVSLSEEFRGATIQYEVHRTAERLDVQQAVDSTQAVIEEFESKKVILDTVLMIVKQLLACIFVRIIFRAQEYHDKYLSDIQFDNMYVTHYFRRIDARRHKAEQHTILPLKKVERVILVDPCSVLPAKQERKKLFHQTLKLILEMVTATTVILLDHLLYEALDIIRRHGHIEYTQEGSHDLTLKVKGTGIIATLVRSILGGLNIRKRIKNIWSNEACLPQPTMMESYYFYKIYGSYFCIWLLLLAEAYTQRLQRVICAYFYPKTEKRRVLFLYNETLKRRRELFKYMRAQVKHTVRERSLELQANVLLALSIQYPKYCSWLRHFAIARRKCLICGEPMSKKSTREDNFSSCPNPECHFVYCFECWKNIRQTCLACTAPDESEGDEEDMLQVKLEGKLNLERFHVKYPYTKVPN